MRAPAFPALVDISHPSLPLVGWFTDPPGLLVQVTMRSEGTLEMARVISDSFVPRALDRYGPDQRVYLVFEFSALTGYHSEARHHLSRAALAIADRVERIAIVVPPSADRMVKTGIHTTASSLSVAGVRTEVEESLTMVQSRLGLCPRARGNTMPPPPGSGPPPKSGLR